MISIFIPLWLEKTFDIIPILLNLLRHILWPGIYASNIYVLAMTIKNVSKYCQMCPNVSWKSNHHQLTTTTLGQPGFLLKYKFNRASSVKRHRFDPWVGKITWGRAWQPTPVFLPGESHGQRSLSGYSP